MQQDGEWYMVPEGLHNYPYVCQMHLHDEIFDDQNDFRGKMLPCKHHHHETGFGQKYRLEFLGIFSRDLLTFFVINFHAYMNPWESSGWLEFGPYCLKTFSKKVGFADAEYECQAQKVPSHLTSIHGTKENAQILSLMKNVTSEKSWIGLTEQPSNGWDRVRILFV